LNTYTAPLLLGILSLLAVASSAHAVRDYGGQFTAEKIANLRANCDKYDWAATQRDNAVAGATFWVAKSDDELWRAIPGQELPRAIDVSMYKGNRPGCPKCGHDIDKFGNYPYTPDLWGKPFKLTCPSCKEVFPKNDFAKYYQSGIDEIGVFNPAKADKSLLFNAEHPDPADPLHNYGVDDGYGWYDSEGHRYLFVAYFVWKYWDSLLNGVDALSNAYLYTGDQKYAHKALVMLDRIGDVYPDYDWAPYAKRGHYHSDGGGGRGKIQGSIWETGTVTTLARCVDRVLSGTKNAPALYAFLADKGKQFKLKREKGTRELLVQNLDDGILREGAKAVYERKAAGNEGMNQSALATCALALDTNPETDKWLDYLFEAKGEHIPTVVVGGIDRDGVGAEAAPGYALSWGINIGKVADLLADYPKYTNHSIYRDFPQFKATCTAGWRIALMNYATPSIGDTGWCGAVGQVNCDPNFIVRGYRYLGDPKIGLAAYYANGNSAKGLGRDIFSADPEKIEREISALAEKAKNDGNPWQGGHNMAGYGLASLEYGFSKSGTGLWMYYGRNGGHGHQDRLNFDVYYKGICMLPDHGYPEYATRWPHREFTTINTLSHNTVMIDGQPQTFDWVGHPEFFYQSGDFGAVRVNSPGVYPNSKQYQRTLAFIKIGDGQAYAVDVFRVQGGKDHLYSLHGMPGEVTTQGLNLTKQDTGTYAGPQVEYKANTSRETGHGYSWIAKIERDGKPADSFIVDWKGQAGWGGITGRDDIHVRYHSFTPLSDVALGDMEPPQNKKGNPRWLRYLLAHRTGENLTSTFAGIIEPYSDKPAIAKADRLKLIGAPSDTQAVALKITLADGTVDYVGFGSDDMTVMKAEGGFEWSGGAAWLRVKDGTVVDSSLVRGTRLALGNFALDLKEPGYTGKIVRMDKDMQGKGNVWVQGPLPAGTILAGQQMIIENDRVRNACYDIESVEKDGDLYKVCLGDVCFIRDYQDRSDYSKGFVYDFEEGANFIIPHSVRVSRTNANTYHVEESGAVELTVPKG
jgi:hypothetical protein